MKVLAIGSIIKAPSDEQRAEIMPKEVPHTLKLFQKQNIGEQA